jgi:hypothetical protein
VYPDDETKPLANSSARGVACAVGAVMVQAFATVLGLGLASRFVVIAVAPAIAVVGIWLSLSARDGRGPAIAGLVVSMAAFVLTGTIAAVALVLALT